MTTRYDVAWWWNGREWLDAPIEDAAEMRSRGVEVRDGLYRMGAPEGQPGTLEPRKRRGAS